MNTRASFTLLGVVWVIIGILEIEGYISEDAFLFASIMLLAFALISPFMGKDF